MKKIKIKIKKGHKVMTSGDPRNMRKKFRMRLRMMKYLKKTETAKFNNQINHQNNKLSKHNRNKNRKRLRLYKSKAKLYKKMRK